MEPIGFAPVADDPPAAYGAYMRVQEEGSGGAWWRSPGPPWTDGVSAGSLHLSGSGDAPR